MNVVIILLYVFLIVIGAISIIISLVSLSNRISESDSSVETKWFKWKAPVRLVFGLLCTLFRPSLIIAHTGLSPADSIL